ncbi:MAG: hypothetical protein AAGG81_06400 [Chlamydiota bacterium]
MEDHQQTNDPYVVTFSDFLGVIRRHRRNICIAIAVCTFLGAFFALNRPVKYLIKASFKERGFANNDGAGKGIGVLLGRKSSDKQSEAKTWFTSHNLLKNLVLTLDLHGAIYPKNKPFFEFHWVMWNNLKVEYSYYLKRPSPYLKESIRPLFLSHLEYEDELPTILNLQFLSETNYLLTDIYGEEVGLGKFGVPFEGETFKFTVNRDEKYPLEQPVYEVYLNSTDVVAKDLKKIISLKNDPLDEELVHLSTIHPDRQRGAELINTLIAIYKINKSNEQKRVADEQLAYLEERQNEAQKNLKRAMHEFAKEQSKDFETRGFVNTDRALEFLATRQLEYQRRLLAIDLENKRLEKVLKEGYVFYDRYTVDGDSTVINQLLQEIRQLRQQADSIKLSLQESPIAFDEDEGIAFDRQMADLEDTQQLIMELRAIEKELANNHLLLPSDSLMNDPRIMLHSWYEKLKDYQQEYEWSQLSPSDWENRKMQFATYIKNLIKLFEVHEKALRERLAHHGELKDEFKGIDLNLANELFIGYNRALNETETQLVKLQFILDSIQQPKFELNSLSSQLNDSISRDLVSNYSRLLLDLQDESNRSQKEQERIRNELLRQRKFLEMHITQSISVLNLTADLQRNKIGALQKMTLALIQLKISLLEKQLENFITSRISNLNNEKLVIEEELHSVKREMATIPELKISEQIMQQRLEQSRDFRREITHLVESKNITNNLEVVLSKTVDEAIAPIFPRTPNVLLFALIGMVLGAFGSVFYYCLIEAIKGVTLTAENLREMNLHVAGEITSSSDDKSVYRRAIQQLTSGPTPKGSIAVVGHGSMKMAKGLAALLQKRGDSVVIVSLAFESKGALHSGGCLLDFLEGGGDFPEAGQIDGINYLGPRRVSSFGSELIASEHFSRFVEQMEKRYRWVLCVSDASVATAEGELVVSLFHRACVVLNDERLETIRDVIRMAKQESSIYMSFIKIADF